MKIENFETTMDIPEAERMGSEKPLVTEEEMKAAVDALEDTGEKEMAENVKVQSEEKSETRDREIDRIRRDLGNIPPVDNSEKRYGGGGNDGEGGDGLQFSRTIEHYHAKQESRKNDQSEIAEKAFGRGLFGFLNLLNPKAWKRYRQMLKEHESSSAMTHTTEYSRIIESKKESGEL